MVNYVTCGFLYLLLCAAICIYADSSYDSCLTPKNKNGKCIVISECPSLVNLLKVRPLPAETTELLSQSQCGFVGKHPKVCCPLIEHDETNLNGEQRAPSVKPPTSDFDSFVAPTKPQILDLSADHSFVPSTTRRAHHVNLPTKPQTQALSAEDFLEFSTKPPEPAAAPTIPLATDFLIDSIPSPIKPPTPHPAAHHTAPSPTKPRTPHSAAHHSVASTAKPSTSHLVSQESPDSSTYDSNAFLLTSLDDCGFFIEDRISPTSDETQLDGYPWMVLLEYETPNGRKFHCGGVLINYRYVLTAAHCVSKGAISKTSNLISVRLGEHKLDTDPDCEKYLFTPSDCCCAKPVVDVGIEEEIIHEQYEPNNSNQYHDIALLRLSNDVTFSEFIRPVCLQPSSHPDISSPGHAAMTGGWGITHLRSQSNVKQSSRMQIKDNIECEFKYADKGLVMHENQLCAYATEGKNVCYGDSGGALMNANHDHFSPMSYYAIGVMSMGHPVCALHEYPVVYTKVEKYIPWIISKLKP